MSESETTAKVPDILIVDDTPENLRVLSGMLRERNYKVRPAPSGRVALQAARSHPPDLILLDINMPEMDGYEVCRELKADQDLQDIPVIFISALSETEDKIKAFRAGGYDYVTKPFEFEEVEARVATQLRLRQLQLQLEDKNSELEDNYRRLRSLENLRDTLVHMIVHDIRAPMSIVKGNLELIAFSTEAGDPDLKQAIDDATLASSDAIDMVSNLLDISRMEEGRMPLECGSHPITEIADHCRRLLGVKARDKSINLQFDISGGNCQGDRELIQRVLINLGANAIKFTPDDGSITIRIRPADNHTEFSVADTGPGVPAADQTTIFEKFGQVAAHQDRKVYSTGLGLTFCKLAVESHGGVIGLESEEGKGSRFWFRLPNKTN